MADGTSVTPGRAVERVTVVGAGYMGAGIAEVLALAGYACTLVDRTAELAAASLERLHADARRHEDDGWIVEGGAARVVAGTIAAGSIEAGCDRADLVIEAVFEDRDVKAGALGAIERSVGREVVIGTNTSSIPIGSLATSLRRPERFVGTHFFNPPQFVPGVEVIAGEDTAESTVELVEDVLRRAGKRPARVADRPGFVANRLQYALFGEAARLVEEGAATPEAVDEIARSTFGFRLPFYGPFAIADMAGLDVYRDTYAVLEAAEPDRFRPPAALLELVESGALGAKSGRGFIVRDRAHGEAMAASRDRRYVALGALLDAAEAEEAAGEPGMGRSEEAGSGATTDRATDEG